VRHGTVQSKVEVNVGKKSVEKLIDAVVDTFSPATETLGLLGDAIRLARIEVATAVTRKAKVIADENGLKLSAPPLKFLIPFFEKVSIEDINDDTLVEMWARLLVSAGSNYSARQMRYSGLLSQMSGDQACILQGIATNYDGVIGVDVDPDAMFYNLIESRLVASLKNITEDDPQKLYESVLNEIAIPGVSVVIVQFELKADKTIHDWTGDEIYADGQSVDFELLRSSDLIEKVATDFFELKHAELTVTLYYMTELGFDFWKACCNVPESK